VAVLVALVLVLLSLAVLAYTYAGYPLLVAWLARRRPMRLDLRAGYEPTVTVCFASHRGARYLPAKIASLQALRYPREKLTFVVCLDGDVDGSRALLTTLVAGDARFTIFEQPERRGKPAALNAMLARAAGDVVVLMDARQPVEAGAIERLVVPLSDPRVGCAAGKLEITGATGPGAYWRYEAWIRAAEGRFRGCVGASGALYALRREDGATVFPIPEDTLLDDVLIPMALTLRGKVTVYCPEALVYDEAFEDAREIDRKVRTLAGNHQLLGRLPALLAPWKNPLCFEWISHKVLRLLGPWLLLLVVGLTVLGAVDARAGARVLWLALAAGEGGCFALAALGPFAGLPGKLARTFVVFQWATVVGLFQQMTGRQTVGWRTP
jgi:cellulose synthase/poly-beta-1,6-N-acetylglucosamine synthase-like glycosyltransferase